MPTPAELCATGGVLAASTALSVSILLQLTHHGRGKAGGSSWPHTEHSTDLRHLQQSAPSILCSHTPDAITTYPDWCLPLTLCPAWLQLQSSAAGHHELPQKNHATFGRGISSSCCRLMQHKG